MENKNYSYSSFYINPVFITKETKNFVYDLIADYSYKSYYDLTPSDKYEFSQILSRLSGKSDEWNFIDAVDSHELISSFRKYLKDQKDSDKEDFIECMIRSFIKNYDYVMHALFEYYQESLIDEAA